MKKSSSACDPVLVEKELERLRSHRRLRRYWRPVLAAVTACVLLLRFVISINIVSGMSMAPSLLPGDVVFSLRIGPAPASGELVIIKEPSGVEMVKRVVGTAGDTLEITPDGHVICNGQSQQESSVWYGEQDTGPWIEFPITLPDDTVFCLGDNRPLSLDSRHRMIGPIPMDEVDGRVLFVLRSTT